MIPVSVSRHDSLILTAAEPTDTDQEEFTLSVTPCPHFGHRGRERSLCFGHQEIKASVSMGLMVEGRLVSWQMTEYHPVSCVHLLGKEGASRFK